ncbi:MAG: VanZ family protein, partial [Deltaproteobacteria bacterium]|nr:VanZ family protein [Deltaproteobacteria bacterium]
LFISFYRNGSATFTRGQVVLICVLFAFMTEMLQFFFDGRQASSVDFAIDAAGILFAAVLSKTTQSKFYLHAFIQRLKIW